MAFNVLSSAQSIKNCYGCKYDSLYTYKYEFNKKGDTNGWDLTSNICIYGAWPTFLFGHSLGRECYIGRTENFISVPAEFKFIIKIIMKVVNRNTDVFKGDHSLTTGRIQWVSLEEDIWDSIKQYDFSIIADGKWHTYELNMGSHTAWVGNINNLRIYPFIDGWKKDCFAISFIGLGSIETYTCSNTNCQYYQYYEHPCKGAGSFGSITSQTNDDGVYTTISGLNDSFSININGYGYETLNLGSNIKFTGSEMAVILTKKISDLGIGAYAYATVEYLSSKVFKIISGALGEDSNIKIKCNSASITLGFFNEEGDDISVYKQGTSCEDGFEYISNTILTTDVINRLIDGDLFSSAYTHASNNYSVDGGRSDFYNVISETVDYRNVENVKKIAWENRLKTVIDISHPINSNGKIHNIYVSGIIHSIEQAKVYILRPLKNGEYKIIYTFNFKVKDSPQISRDSMFYSVECNEYVQKGDVIGFYNIDLFFSAGKRDKPDAMFFQFDGEPSGTFNPGKLLNYGVSGFLYHCFSNNKQTNLIFDIDLGDRVNIKELNTFGSILSTNNTYNVCICKDIEFLCDMYGSTHTHHNAFVTATHTNKGFGLDALTDGEELAINGEVGTDYGKDSDGLWTLGKHSYFYVNGGDEFSTRDPDRHIVGGEMQDRPTADGPYPFTGPENFENDPISLYTTWDYGFAIPIEKTIIYFKDVYNFRHMELSYYLGSYNATGNASLEEYFNRIPFYNSIKLDGNDIVKEENEYIYENPTYSKPIFENAVCINGEAVRVISQAKWFVYECNFGPVDAYGFRIYTDYHKSTRISEIEVYSTFDVDKKNEIVLSDILNVSTSKYGDLWSNIDFNTEDDKSVGIIGDSPRYIKFEFIGGNSTFQINEIEGVLDNNIKLEGCLNTVFLEDSKNNVINKATEFKLTNTYDIPLDLDININKDLITSDRILLHNIPDSYDHVSNSLIGPGGKVYKYHEAHTIKTVYGNCSSGAKCYLLKNLAAGKKYYYNIDDNSWKESVIGINGIVNYNCKENLRKNVLEFEYAQAGKFFDIGIYSPEYSSEVFMLKAYYENDILPIKNIYVGELDCNISELNPLSYNNDTYYIEGFTVLKDEFNDGIISSNWEVDDNSGEYPIVETEDGISSIKCNGTFPYIQRELDSLTTDFEMIIKLDQDFLSEVYRSPKHVYTHNLLPSFTLNIYFYNEKGYEMFKIQPVRVSSNIADSEVSSNEKLYEVSTVTNSNYWYSGGKMDVFTSDSVSKGEITVRRVDRVLTVTSDTGKIFGGENTVSDNSFRINDSIKYVKISWGSSGIVYSDRDLYDAAIEEIESMASTKFDYPISYNKCVLKSVEIKRLCSISMFEHLYIEFEQPKYVTKFELYGKAFWLGIDAYYNPNDILAIMGIRKSMDGIIYEQAASTKSESDTFCLDGNGHAVSSDRIMAEDGSLLYNILFSGIRYFSSYYRSDWKKDNFIMDMYFCFLREMPFKHDGSGWAIYDFRKDNNYIFDIITILFSKYEYPHSINIYGLNEDDCSNYKDLIWSEDYDIWSVELPISDYDLLVSISDVYNHDGFQSNYDIYIPDHGIVNRSYLTIPMPTTKSYRAYVIKFHREDTTYTQVYNIMFKKNLSTNLLTLTAEEYNEELVIDLEKRHTLGWMRHYWREGKSGGYNKFEDYVSPMRFIGLQYDNLSFSSSNVDNPNDIIWGVDIDFMDDFSDGVYNDKWYFIRLENEILFENNGKLSVYSYGNYIQDWYGPTVTRTFDKTIAIEFIIHLMCKADITESGRTTIDFKDLNGSTIIKLVIEIINGVAESRLYENDELIYNGGSEISINSLNTIKILREIKPVKLKYMVADIIIYEYEMNSEDVLCSVDIKFDKYKTFTAFSEHYMSFVSIAIGSELDNVRWVKLTLENTDINLFGTYIEYLSIYPDISKVHTIDSEINCEWEQFPYDITNVIEDAVNIAKYAKVTTNYSNPLYEVTNVVNGDNTGINGYWELDVLPNGDLPYVDIDFEREVKIKEVRMYHGRYDVDKEYKNVCFSSGYTPYVFSSAGEEELSVGQHGLTTAYYDQKLDFSLTNKLGIKVPSVILLTCVIDMPSVYFKEYRDYYEFAPELSVEFCETTTFFDPELSNIILGIGNININMRTCSDYKVSAEVSITFDTDTDFTIGGIRINCKNYSELDYWGFSDICLINHNIGDNSPSDFSCYQRYGSYSIQGSTTASGEDFKYICPSENKLTIECSPSDAFVKSIRNGYASKYEYTIEIEGNDYNKYHKYDSVSIRRLRVLFKRWEGTPLTRYNNLTNSYESFKGSYLREIEVYEYNPREKIPNVEALGGYNYSDTGIPVPFISSFDYPIIAFDLDKKYDITQIKTSWKYKFRLNPEVAAVANCMEVKNSWNISDLDIRYSNDVYSDPSKITFSSKDNKQIIYESTDSSGIVLSYLEDDSKGITEYIFDSNVFINKGNYDMYFEAYLVTSESKISIWFEGNNFYECEITTVSSGTLWDPFYEHVSIGESGFYTIKAKQNNNYEEDWGLRKPTLYLVQGDSKQWVSLIHNNSFMDKKKSIDVINYIEMRAGNGFGPTENSDWWESIFSILSTEKMIVKESSSAVRIDYLGGSMIDQISYREDDCFSQDEYWSVRDKLTLWFYISDINSINLNNSYIIYGNIEIKVFDYGSATSDEPSYYTWKLDNYNIINGWNKLELKFNEYYDVFPKDALSEFNLTGSIDNILQYNDKFGLSTFQLYIDGKENPCTIILDTLKYERTEFLPVKDNVGIYLSGTESLIFNINNLSLKRGTVEFDVKLSSDNTGKNSFGDNNAVTLLSIITNNNEIITLFISIGKGLNICVGTIGKELYITDTYFSKNDTSNYISIYDDAKIKVVWSHDGTEMGNSDTFRLYVDDEWLYSISDLWAINSNSISSIIFGGMTTSAASLITDGSGVFSNIKVYNYCKLDNNVISDTIRANDFLEISKDNENFFKIDDENLPIQFKGVDSGETITAYVRSNKKNNFNNVIEATGNLIVNWTLIV